MNPPTCGPSPIIISTSYGDLYGGTDGREEKGADWVWGSTAWLIDDDDRASLCLWVAYSVSRVKRFDTMTTLWLTAIVLVTSTSSTARSMSKTNRGFLISLMSFIMFFCGDGINEFGQAAVWDVIRRTVNFTARLHTSFRWFQSCFCMAAYSAHGSAYGQLRGDTTYTLPARSCHQLAPSKWWWSLFDDGIQDSRF